MKKIVRYLNLTAAIPMLALIGSMGTAQAQATRTWVSGVGDDVNPCSRTAPCKTFAGAISKTAINGEINCLDPGGFGAVTIVKSMTIDCHEVMAGIVTGTGNGIVISIAAGNANDPLRTVRLRNININGGGQSGTVGTRLGLVGVRIDAATAVFLDDMLVYNMGQRGLLDQRTSAGKLYIHNSTFRDNTGAGILIFPSSGSATLDAVLDGVHSNGNGNGGVVIGNGPRAVVKRSTFSGNATGVDVEGTLSSTSLTLDDCEVSHNGTGMFTSGSASLRISNSDIAFNTTGITGAGVGSFTNSRFTGNGAGAPSPIGVVTNPTGQQ
jgi:Right handed beta helix region